ncbi:hypothetical protein EMN47_02520 [Prolixibacteraceae bacterium JC049]|nr:hypothetical protein [Prolixibacteraceae bacterium JC049]
MNYNNTNRIEEEIRQKKLYKIQVAEAQVRKYENLFHTISEKKLIKLSKNVSSNILRTIILITSILLFILSIFLFFSEFTITLLEKYGNEFSLIEESNFIQFAPKGAILIFIISILLYLISFLLKKNTTKRNSLFELSNLITEVIDYMSKNIKEDKIRYEHFVDSSAEINNNLN